VCQSVGDAFRLVASDGVERGVAVAVNQRERVALTRRCGLAVAHQQQLAGTGWALEAELPVGAGVWRFLGALGAHETLPAQRRTWLSRRSTYQNSSITEAKSWTAAPT
jgi:hypothetical protein